MEVHVGITLRLIDEAHRCLSDAHRCLLWSFQCDSQAVESKAQ